MPGYEVPKDSPCDVWTPSKGRRQCGVAFEEDCERQVPVSKQPEQRPEAQNTRKIAPSVGSCDEDVAWR
jgi:hypothetical protein